MKVTEEQITEAICDFLTLLGGQVNRIAPSGFFRGGTMRKHKSKHIKLGVSDIQYMWHRQMYFFEVKTPTEYKFAIKHYQEILKTPAEFLSARKKHLQDQIFYLEAAKKNGFIGEFVCSAKMVRDIILKPSVAG